ncbi:MAG: hypothetical protein J6Q72_01100, partial [Clostridia bacterium]|nr:hypothetical protein [Clostridia bacterium]
YALNKNKHIVVILENNSILKLIEKKQPGLYMRIEHIQALSMNSCRSNDDFLCLLLATPHFKPCRLTESAVISPTTLGDNGSIGISALFKNKKLFKTLVSGALALSLLTVVVFVVASRSSSDDGVQSQDSSRYDISFQSPAEQSDSSHDADTTTDTNSSLDESESELYALYDHADRLYKNQQYAEAGIAFAKCGDFQNAKIRSQKSWEQVDGCLRTTISAYNLYTENGLFWISEDGVLMQQESNDPPIRHDDMNDLVSIAVGYNVVAGLKSDGSVSVISYGEYIDTSEWKDIVSITAGDECLIGLKSDGTVVASGNNDNGQCNVSEWNDIVSIRCWHSEDTTVGVKTDGTVVYTSNNLEPYTANYLDNIKNAKYLATSELVLIDNEFKAIIPYEGAPSFSNAKDLAYDIGTHYFVLSATQVAAYDVETLQPHDYMPLLDENFCNICYELQTPSLQYIDQISVSWFQVFILYYNGEIKTFNIDAFPHECLKLPEGTKAKKSFN